MRDRWLMVEVMVKKHSLRRTDAPHSANYLASCMKNELIAPFLGDACSR